MVNIPASETHLNWYKQAIEDIYSDQDFQDNMMINLHQYKYYLFPNKTILMGIYY